jgi:hypothetical protein
VSLLAAVPDHVLKARDDQKDQDAHEELVRRGLRYDRKVLAQAVRDHRRYARERANGRER